MTSKTAGNPTRENPPEALSGDVLPNPAVEYDRRPISSLIPFPGNARRGNLPLIADSLAHYGQYRPIVVQKATSHVIAGNNTLIAAESIGWGELDCAVIDVDDQTALRINLLDNRANDLADYDLGALLTQLQVLPDLTGVGYSTSDLDQLLADLDDQNQPGTGRTDPDDAPERPTQPLSEPGDTWTLGRHRLVVGDATKAATWVALLDRTKPDLLWTDPPYGVTIVGGNHALSPEERLARGGKTIVNDSLEGDALQQLLGSVFDHARAHCRPGAAVYVTAPPGPPFVDFALPLAARNIWRQTLVWAKDSLVMGRSDYHYRHEAIFYGWLPGAAHHQPAERTHDTVWEIARPKRSTEHPTMKPVELVARAVNNSTEPGGLVVDPFAGAGSTLIACHQTGRQAALIELDPGYADVICRRWQQHTGIRPERDGQPVDFETVAEGS